jgi:hypothetical protein
MRACRTRLRRTQVSPLVGAVAVGSVVMTVIMVKYFGFHSDITFSKTLRQDPEHTGASDLRVAGHNNKLGISILKEHAFSIFPFRYVPMEGAYRAHVPMYACI